MQVSVVGGEPHASAWSWVMRFGTPAEAPA
jgi:hypothetical protein